MILIPLSVPGKPVWLDFYTDLNGNGTYDFPPTDQAWRIIEDGTNEGLTLQFTHNPDFTDIGL